MAVNRFFKPVDYEYTPIPFQELVTLGKYYADERKQAEKDLANYIRKANEFTSLISKDVDTYNKTAFNSQIKQYIEQAASNPSVMKDMGWRSGLQAAMNAVDYGMLNKLKSSAEAAKTYDTAVKKLAMEGKMPPGWEPNYFDTYSTEQSGVFNATPLAWQSRNDIVHKYVDNLKPSLITTKDGWDYYGVSEDRTLAQVDAAESEIMSLPVIQRNLQNRSAMYQQMGLSKEEAFNRAYIDEWGEIQNEAVEKAWFDRRENKYALMNYQHKLATGDGDQPNAVTTRVMEHQQQAQRVIADKYTKQLDGFAKQRLLNPDAKFTDLSKEDQDEALTQIAMSIKQTGLTKDMMAPLSKVEYYNWSGAMNGEKAMDMGSVLDEDGNAIKSGENYRYRTGDVIYTPNGKVLTSLNPAFVVGKNNFTQEEAEIMFSDILNNIKENAIYDMDGKAHIYNHGSGPNTMQTDGYLYVTEEALENAVKAAAPEIYGKLMDLFHYGVKDANGEKYKILQSVDGSINGQDDLYMIRVGRDFGNVDSMNMDFNRRYIGDVAGSGTVSKNYTPIIMQSAFEAGN